MAEAYRCIVADPPWLEQGGGKIKRGADRHYPLMRLSDIAKTMWTAPEWRPAADCHLWLWTTNNFLIDALSLVEQLGFRYVTNMVWVKVRIERDGQLQIGLGQYLRGSHELCLFATKGKASLPAVAPPSVIFAERTEHSQKPDEAFEVFEQVSPGPRLEMFARTDRPGWSSWGNEIAKEEITHENGEMNG
jgi:N6-adenosine-specific RNA methylase IME4